MLLNTGAALGGPKALRRLAMRSRGAARRSRQGAEIVTLNGVKGAISGMAPFGALRVKRWGDDYATACSF